MYLFCGFLCFLFPAADLVQNTQRYCEILFCTFLVANMYSSHHSCSSSVKQCNRCCRCYMSTYSYLSLFFFLNYVSNF